MIIDTHAHYDDEQFDPDRNELLKSMEAGGIGLIVDAGSTVASWGKIVKLTEEYPFMYGAIGVHPDEVGQTCLIWIRLLLWARSGWTITGIRKSMTFRRNGSSGSLSLPGKRICR